MGELALGAAWGLTAAVSNPHYCVPRTVLASLMYTQGSENSKDMLVQPRWKHGGKSVFAKWRQEELVGKETFCFQVLEYYRSKVRAPE